MISERYETFTSERYDGTAHSPPTALQSGNQGVESLAASTMLDRISGKAPE